MRKSVTTRLMLALVAALMLALVVATQAAPPAQEVGPAQGAGFLPARVAFVHAAPFSGSSAVTLTVGQAGQTRIIRSGLTISETVSYLSLPAGTYTFRIYPGTLDADDLATTLPAISENLTLQGGIDYTVVAAGTGPGAPYPFRLIALTDTRPAFNEATQGLVRVVHAAPIPPGPASATVDVVNEADDSVIVNDLAYGAGSPFLALAANTYDVRVDAATTPPSTVFDPDPLTVEAGAVVTLVAVIDGAGTPGLVPVVFTPRANAEVRVVHAAPFAAGDATATPVLDPTFGSAANAVFKPLNYGQSTLYKTVAPGIYDAKVVAGAAITGTVALTQSLTIEDGQRLTVVVVGSGQAPFPLELVVLDDSAAPSPGSASAAVRIFHAAPFAATVAGTGVDVVAQDNSPLSPPITNLVYKETTEFAGPPPSQYITVPSGTPIDLKVVLTGTTDTAIDPPPVTFPAGTVQTIIAIGGPNGKLPSVIVLNDLLQTQRLWLPAVWQTE